MESFRFGASVVLGAALADTFGPVLGSAERKIGALGEAAERVRLGGDFGRESGGELVGEILRLDSALEGLRQRQQAVGGASAFLGGRIAGIGRAFVGAARSVRAHGAAVGRAAATHRQFAALDDRGPAPSGRAERGEARRERQRLAAAAPPSPGFAHGAGRFLGKAMEMRNRVRLQTVIESDDGDLEAAARRARENALALVRTTLAAGTGVVVLPYDLAAAGAEVAHEAAVSPKAVPEEVAAPIGAAFDDLGAMTGAIVGALAGADPAEKIGRPGEVLTRVRQGFRIGDLGPPGAGMAEAAAGAAPAGSPFDPAAADPGVRFVRSSDSGPASAASPAAIGAGRSGGSDGRASRIPAPVGDEDSPGPAPPTGSLDGFRDGLAAAIASVDAFGSAWEEVSESASAFRRLGAEAMEAYRSVGRLGRQLTLTNLKAKALAVGGAMQRFGTSVMDTARTAGQGLADLGRRFTLTNLRMKALAVGGAMRRFGTGVMDAARAAGQGLAGLGRRLLATRVRMAALAVGGAVQKFGAALVGLASGGIKAAIVGLRALGVAIAANPIGLIVTAVVLVAALVWKYWKPIKAFFGRLFAPLIEFARPIFAWIGEKVAAIAGWVRKAVGVVGPAFAVFLGPIGLLIGAAALVWKYWEPIKAFFGRLFAPLVEFARPIFAWIGAKVAAVAGWIRARLRPVADFFGRVFGAIAEFLRPVFAWIGEKVSAVAGWIYERLRPVADFFGRVFGAIAEFLRPVFAWIGEKVAAVVGWVRQAISEGRPAVALLLGPIGLLVGAALLLYRAWGPIKAFFGAIWDGIAAGAGAAFGFLGRVWEGVKSAFSGLRSVVQGAVGAVFSWLGNFSLADIGKNLLATLGDGILAAKDAVVEKVGAVFAAVRNLLPFSDAREGPFAHLTTSGAAILGTVGQGVRRAGPGPLRRPLQAALGAAVVGLGVPAAASGFPAPPSGPPPGLPAGSASAKQVVISPGAVSPGAVVLHFHGPADDPARIAQEVERQLADLFRRAANEARLLETDDA